MAALDPDGRSKCWVVTRSLRDICIGTNAYKSLVKGRRRPRWLSWMRRPTGGCGFKPRRGRQHSVVETDHEIFSTVILSLPLFQEGQLSISGERMCTILVNRLED